MSFSKNQMHTQEYVYDFSKDGGAVGVLDLSAKDGKPSLPEGAVVKRVMGIVEQAFTSGGAATFSYGSAADSDLYSTDAKALGALTAGAVFDFDALNRIDGVANNQSVVCEIATAAMTAGKMRVVVEFYMPGLEA